MRKTSYVGTVSNIHKGIFSFLKNRGFSQIPILSGSSTKVINWKLDVAPPALIPTTLTNPTIHTIPTTRPRPNRFNWRPTLPAPPTLPTLPTLPALPTLPNSIKPPFFRSTENRVPLYTISMQITQRYLFKYAIIYVLFTNF